MAAEVCVDPFPRTGVSPMSISMLIIVLLFYVLITPYNEQVAGELCYNHGDGNFIMKT